MGTTNKMTLETYVKDWNIFIDTCSLMHQGADLFWQRIIPYLHLYQKKVYMPYNCLKEVKKLCAKTEEPAVSNRANRVFNTLKTLYKGGCCAFLGDKQDPFPDQYFQTIFMKYRTNANMLLITQDNNLAKDIMRLNEIKSVNGKEVQAKRFDYIGHLSRYAWELNKPNPENKPKMVNKRGRTINSREILKLASKVSSIPDNQRPLSHVPQESEAVYTSKGTIRLVHKVAEGGEGAIYTTDTSYVAKIYKADCNTNRRYEKIKRMVDRHLSCQGICFPVDILYNDRHEFVGYLMDQAKGKELQKSIFIKPLFLRTFPNWKKIDTVQLCITILKKIQYLHDRHIIMGDINPCNILVVSPTEVYFVDTDSYQIEDLPCPVGTTLFTAPEIQGKKFADFLRSFGHENFAIATLLFMIMLPGKPPYSQQGGESLAANIMAMDFSYPFGENTNKKTPDGPWRFIWSHLTYEVKEAFYNTFRKGGKYASEPKRLTVDDWLRLLNKYYGLLKDGLLAKNDEMSEDLFPTRFKKNPKAGITYVRCKLCGQEYPEGQGTDGYCNNCLNKGIEYKCKKCGKIMFYTNRDRLIKGKKRYDTCYECKQEGQKVHSVITCKDCGKTFELTNDEYDYYKKNGLHIPCHCKSCIAKRKAGNSQPQTTYTRPQSTTSTYTHSHTSTTSYTPKHQRSLTVWRQLFLMFKYLFIAFIIYKLVCLFI